MRARCVGDMATMTVQQAYELAVRLGQAGRGEEAQSLCRQIVEHQPGFAPAWSMLAGIAHQTGKMDQAIEAYRKLAALEPANADVHFFLGNALRHQRKMEQAVEAYRRATDRADFFEAWMNLGLSLEQLGRPLEAIGPYQQAVRVRPEVEQLHRKLAELLVRRRDWGEAVRSYRQVLSLNPDIAEAHQDLGFALQKLGQIDEAMASYRRALELKPDLAEAHNNLGNALLAQGDLDGAARSYESALLIRPDFADAHSNLGSVHVAKLDLDVAMSSYETALSISPACADAHWNRALLWLLEGDYERGWPEYEWRWRKSPELQRDFAQPMWDGSHLRTKTILLHAEQGFGDTIQFVRFASMVAARAPKVILECQPELVRLLQRVAGVSQVIARGDPLPGFDVHCPLLSLPHVLKLRPDNIPAEVPYIRTQIRNTNPEIRNKSEIRRENDQNSSLAPSAFGNSDLFRISDFDIRASRPLGVGLVWSGSPAHPRDDERSIPPELLSSLAQVEGVQFFSLQKDSATQNPLPFEMLDLTKDLHDFADTAALIANLDLVISVDTAVAHLAGALGKPVWVLLPFVPDWRWMLEREDSPWYPTMRLFRQPRPGDWGTAVTHVARELPG